MSIEVDRVEGRETEGDGCGDDGEVGDAVEGDCESRNCMDVESEGSGGVGGVLVGDSVTVEMVTVGRRGEVKGHPNVLGYSLPFSEQVTPV